MASTIALWYLRRQEHEIVGRAPTLEVHINLWRHNPGDKDHNLLDIGIRILDVQDLSAIKLFVPTAASTADVKDLGSLLTKEDTLNAVFNEVLSIGTRDSKTNAFSIKRSGKPYLTVHPINVTDHLAIEPQVEGTEQFGTLVSVRPGFCQQFHTPGEHYIRLRIRLSNGSEKAFSSDTSAQDGVVLSSIAVSEITEVRFNEARSLPKPLINRASREKWLSPRIETLHYFLVRDSGFDLIASHSNFRKMRRLEAKIWDDYLRDLSPDISADKMIIYHWRHGASGEPVSDVVTLAKFRRARNNLSRYALVVILLGALGSGVQALFVSLWKLASSSDIFASVMALGMIIGGLLIAYRRWRLKE